MRAGLHFALLGAGLLWNASASAAESGGFTLETGSPDALCPELEVTRELVARRLGSLVVEGRRGWRARYTIGHAPSGTPRDFVRLELFSPEGRVELVRDLPIEGDSCRTMAEVIALVLDRYFRGLGADDERPAAPAPPPVPTPPPAAAPRTAAPVTAPPSIAFARRLSAEYVFTAPVSRSWLGLRASAALASRLEVGLGLRLALTPLRERAPGGASVEARAVEARSTVAWRLPLPLGLLHLGPVLSLMLEPATTTGLANATDRTRLRWSLGGQAGFVVPLGPAFFLEASGFADVLLSSGHFFVEEQELLRPRRLTLGGALGFGYSWGD